MKHIDIDNAITKTILFSFLMVWLLVSTYVIGSTVEEDFGKIRINQRIRNVDYNRSNGYFCWDWYSIKIRDLQHKGGRLQLTDANGTQLLLPMFTRDTLKPFILSPFLPDINVKQGLCTFIPPGFKPKAPFTLSAYIIYPGFLNLWNVRSYLPTIIYEDNNQYTTNGNNDKQTAIFHTKGENQDAY